MILQTTCLGTDYILTFLSKMPQAHPQPTPFLTPTPGPFPGHPSNMHLTNLGPAISRYCEIGLAPATHNGYRTGLQRSAHSIT